MRTALFLLTLWIAGCTADQSPTVTTTSSMAECLVVDIREPAEFAAGHVPGALNIQLGWSQLAERIEAYLPDQETSLAVRSQDKSQARLAISLLRREGYRDVTHFLPDQEPAQLALWEAKKLRTELESAKPPIVIDVRSQAEYATGTIEGALLFEQDEASSRLDELAPEARYAIICEGGWPSSQLASLMKRKGFEQVVNVIDGMAGWRTLED